MTADDINPARWVEVPKCDNHRLGLFIVPAVRHGARCRLAVDWLDTVTLSGEPVVHLVFEFKKLSDPFAENNLSCVGIACSCKVRRPNARLVAAVPRFDFAPSARLRPGP